MEVRMGSKTGCVVSGIEGVLAEIQARLQADPKAWLKTLEQNPSEFTKLEQEVHQTFSGMADRLIASLLAQATADSGFADAAQKK